jgi:hypothetical protein
VIEWEKRIDQTRITEEPEEQEKRPGMRVHIKYFRGSGIDKGKKSYV